MTILTFIETLIRIFMLSFYGFFSKSFAFFSPFLWLLNGLTSTILAVSGAMRPLDDRVVGLPKAGSYGSFEWSYMAS